MEVDSPFGGKLAPGHLAVGLGVHLQGCLTQKFRQTGGDIAAFGDAGLFPDHKARDPWLAVLERFRW